MDAENLIWVVIFVIYVVSVIAKRLRGAAKPTDGAPAPRVPRLAEKIEAWLGQVRRELEAAAKKPVSPPAGWEQVAPPREDWAEEAPEPAADAAPPAPKRVMARKPKPPVRKAPPQAPAPAVVSVKRRVDDFSSLEVQDLRRAVIWSEILGPPLALRERQEF